MFCNWSKITSGVPQGSVLGPVFFIIYVNDLPDIVANSYTVYMFADDTKLYRVKDSDSDTSSLQQDLNHLAHWCDTWQMFFNINKCKIMSLGNTISTSVYTMMSTDVNLPVICVYEEQDLGVLFTSNLRFGGHINQIVHKANRLIGLIKQTFKGHNL